MTPNNLPGRLLVCTDFDGTIHNDLESPAIAGSFQEIIADLQRQGAHWVINTGRERCDLLREMDRAQLRVTPDYLVVVEREIYLWDGSQYVSHHPWNDRCTHTHARLFERMRSAVSEWAEWVNRRFVAQVYEDTWSPFCLVAANVHDAALIVRQMEDWCRPWPELNVVSNHVYARLSHVEYHKGSALREVASLCNAGPATTFVAGDHLNDLPMLRREHARWLMAPSNAIPQVKQAVMDAGGWIEDGVAGQAVAAGLRRCFLREGGTVRSLC
jgi:hydroxymethylpyrimidine pyrophosphatase-like HAD family hydrolase